MTAKRDFYSALGVTRGASADEIRRAHRRLARELHPDVNKKPDAAARFNEVQEAYDVLSDAEKRAVYDRVGHAAYTSGVTGGGGGHGAARGGRAPSGTYTWSNIGREPGGPSGAESAFTAEDIGSIFDEFFGARGARGGWQEDDEEFAQRAGSTARGRARSMHVEQPIEIPFLTALSGGVQTIRLSGGDSSQTIDVTIPKGIADGAKLRLRGKGGEGPGGPRDLILIVRVAAHARYRREGLDLFAELPVTIVEATLGAKVEIETPRGGVGLTVPPGTSSGARLRLKGRGVETADGRMGDFFAVVKIVAPGPEALRESDRAALKELGARLPAPR